MRIRFHRLASVSLASITIFSGIAVLGLSYAVVEQWTNAGPYKITDRAGDLFAKPYGSHSATIDGDVAQYLEDNYPQRKEDGWCLNKVGGEYSEINEPETIVRGRMWVVFTCENPDAVKIHSHLVTAISSSADREKVGNKQPSCIYSGGEISGNHPVNLNCYQKDEENLTRRVSVKVTS